MHKIVKEGFVLPVKSYGLKEICKDQKLVDFQWSDRDSGSAWSIVQYNNYLDEKDPVKKEALKLKILEYNRDDVRATRALEVWLREQDKINFPPRTRKKAPKP